MARKRILIGKPLFRKKVSAAYIRAHQKTLGVPAELLRIEESYEGIEQKMGDHFIDAASRDLLLNRAVRQKTRDMDNVFSEEKKALQKAHGAREQRKRGIIGFVRWLFAGTKARGRLRARDEQKLKKIIARLRDKDAVIKKINRPKE